MKLLSKKKCISEQLEDTDHHLRECQHKPEHWQFCPEVPAVTLRNGSKRELTTRVNTALNSHGGKKQKPMTAMELVTSLSVNELTEVCAAINTRQNEDHDAGAVVEHEAIQVLTKLNSTSPVATSS